MIDALHVRGESEVTCLIVDDHPAVSQLLARYLEERGIAVVGQAQDGREVLAALERLRPSVVLLDLRMPHASGIEVARAIARRKDLGSAVIVYTGYGDHDRLVQAIDAGARGFLQKDAPLEEVVRAITLVAGGATYIDPVLASFLATPEAAARLNAVSPREREVLGLLANGSTTEEVARALFISRETVRVHLRNAVAKLHAKSRTQAVANAIREGLIQ